MVNTKESETDSNAHDAVPVTVIVNVTFVFVLSAVLGVYTGVFEVALLNEPEPVVVQATVPFEEVPVIESVFP